MNSSAARGECLRSAPETLPGTQRLTGRQIGTLLALGAIFWFVAAMYVRFLGPLGAFDGAGWFLSYALALPVTVGFIWISKTVARLSRHQILAAVGVVAGIATVLDALALSWFRWLYGIDDGTVLGGAAFILWGVGLALALATVIHESDSTS